MRTKTSKFGLVQLVFTLAAIFLLFITSSGCIGTKITTDPIDPTLSTSSEFLSATKNNDSVNPTNPMETKILIDPSSAISSFSQTITPTVFEINGLSQTTTPELFVPTTNLPITEAISDEEIVFLSTHEINVGDTNRKIIMMTYDDGGNSQNIEKIMTAVEKFHGEVTFFVSGVWLAKNPDLARKIVARGHVLGCHGWDHTDMNKLTDAQVKKQISDFIKTAEGTIPGYKVEFIRFPYGSRNDLDLQIAAEFGLQSIRWGGGSGGMDESTYRNVVDRAYPGKIVLSHSTRWYDVELAESIFTNLFSKGYSFESVKTGRSPDDIWNNQE
jgi:peptidoglycan/xylan/chitin deacetylase (PgdA/CDA1 family)